MRDLTEFLDALGLVAPLGELPLRVTYQDSCHLLHGQKIREAPRRLIRADTWGRAGGNAAGRQLLRFGRRLQRNRNARVARTSGGKNGLRAATGAATIVTANPGCLLQMRAGAEIHGTNQEVLHVAELLDGPYRRPHRRHARSHGNSHDRAR